MMIYEKYITEVSGMFDGRKPKGEEDFAAFFENRSSQMIDLADRGKTKELKKLIELYIKELKELSRMM